jgi:carbamoyl-phosphate synthase small subunit
VNAEDGESRRVYAEGLVVRDVPRLLSSWRSQGDLTSYLKKNKVVGIAELDTRKLTRILREKGAQNGCVMAGDVSTDVALSKAKAFPGASRHGPRQGGHHDQPYEWTEGRWRARAPATASWKTRASTSSPTTTASSTTSCG